MNIIGAIALIVIGSVCLWRALTDWTAAVMLRDLPNRYAMFSLIWFAVFAALFFLAGLAL